MDLRQDFVSQLARQLNSSIAYRAMHFQWVCFLSAPVAVGILALCLYGVVPDEILSLAIGVSIGLYVYTFAKLVAQDAKLVRECINRVLRNRSDMRLYLVQSANTQWADADEDGWTRSTPKFGFSFF